jgi:hypothetical protein
MEKLSSRTIVQNHHIEGLSLEELLHLNQERKSDLLINLSFVDYKVKLSVDPIFLDKFGSIKLSIPPVSTKVDLAESANTDAFKHIVGLESPEFLILICLEDALQVQSIPNPPISSLHLVIREPVGIDSLVVRYPARVASQCV